MKDFIDGLRHGQGTLFYHWYLFRIINLINSQTWNYIIIKNKDMETFKIINLMVLVLTLTLVVIL